MSTWVGAAYGRDANGKLKAPPLTQFAAEIGVSYKTVLRMRDLIKRAASKYRGYKDGFGRLPRSFMKHRSSPRLTADYRHRKRTLLAT